MTDLKTQFTIKAGHGAKNEMQRFFHGLNIDAIVKVDPDLPLYGYELRSEGRTVYGTFKPGAFYE